MIISALETVFSYIDNPTNYLKERNDHNVITIPDILALGGFMVVVYAIFFIIEEKRKKV